MPQVPLSLSAMSGRTSDSPITYFIQMAVRNPALISLAAGLVDEESLPARDIAAAAHDILSDPVSARAALQYGTTEGYAELRDRILRRLAADDNSTPDEMGLTADDVVVTSGSQQMLQLLGEVLLDPGDIVLCEAPSYFVYHGVLASLGARVVPVPMDDNGLDTDAVEDVLARLQGNGELARVKLIYTCDYFQNPTGLTLALGRRQHLLELARKYSTSHRILILEDAAYRELRYDGADLPSIKSFDESNEFVIWTSTFSKPCAPGLKTGYGVLPRDLVSPVTWLKGNHDFGSANLIQHLLVKLLDTGAYDRHVLSLREVYRTKRDAMLEALDAEFGSASGLRWTRPAGGLYVWLTCPDEMQTGPESRLMTAALREGVLYVPGEFCHVPHADGRLPKTEARLSFGVASPEKIREAIGRLRRASRAAGHEVFVGARAEVVSQR